MPLFPIFPTFCRCQIPSQLAVRYRSVLYTSKVNTEQTSDVGSLHDGPSASALSKPRRRLGTTHPWPGCTSLPPGGLGSDLGLHPPCFPRASGFAGPGRSIFPSSLTLIIPSSRNRFSKEERRRKIQEPTDNRAVIIRG